MPEPFGARADVGAGPGQNGAMEQTNIVKVAGLTRTLLFNDLEAFLTTTTEDTWL